MHIAHRFYLRGFLHLAFAALVAMPATADQIASPTGEVSGRMVDQQRQPIAGAKVWIQETQGSDVLGETASDADGRFTIRNLPIGCRRIVLIDAPGLGREFRDDIAVFPGRAIDLGAIRALPGYVFRGRVVDAAGEPVAASAVVVEAFRHESGHVVSQLGPAWPLTTDAAGRFATPALPASFAIFQIKRANGLVLGNFVDRMAGPDSADFDLPDLRLVAEAPINGTVIDEVGLPIADAEVWCNMMGCESVKTDAQGYFALHGLLKRDLKNVVVGVEADGFGVYRKHDPDAELPLKIMLHPCRYIVGRAIDADTGQPVSLKRVVVCAVRRDDDGTPHMSGCGDVRFEQKSPGEFRAAVAPFGEKHLMVIADGYHNAEQYVLGFDLLGGEPEVTIKLRRNGSAVSVASQRVRGVVRAAGKPAGPAWVSLWQKTKEHEAAGSALRRGRTVDGTYRPARIDALTADDGSYLLDVVDPGEYCVTAQPFAGAPATSPAFMIKAGEELAQDLELPAGATIRGQVKNVSPELAERLWVVAFARTPFQRAVPVDREGRFTLEGVPPGEIGLKVGHEGYLDADVARMPIVKETWERIGEPWKRAHLVTAPANQTVEGVELEYPAPGPPDVLDE